ncbi:MAG: hypothetical protein CL945_10795 [Dinoroseobacter sp.]|nr:hypothetical protein [Dinoroseobacter sp.]
MQSSDTGISSHDLPPLTFVGSDREETVLELSRSAGQILACAEVVKARIGQGQNVGLCFRTGPDLVLWWFGALLAGARPLIMQYPTGKQAKSYWESSVNDTIGRAELELIIADAPTTARLSEHHDALLLNSALPDPLPQTSFVLDDFSIIQLSSGTTGFRKAVEFTSQALRFHAEDYNETLQLAGDDVIVSWLPLYHDMGYVACFVVPLFLGVPVVMTDPEVWVQDKSILFSMIEKYNGTICYMPNFGFEVMCNFAPAKMNSMRYWISCSEPVFERTARKFMAHIGQDEDRFSACYAMAENIFAISQSTGIKTAMIDDVAVVSCGPPIPNVDIKIVDGEIWVRSRSSITSYLSQDSITDEDGYYPTGDMGEVIDGELHVTGRKRDILVQAGKKFMLSTIDGIVNQVVPEARGRVATVEDFDDRLATSKAIVLIEAKDFITRDDHGAVARKILDESGLDHLEVQFVPPRFLTKTSSGKMNRPISLAHWKAVEAAKTRSLAVDVASEIIREFKHLPFDKPIRETLDSLSATVLRIIIGDAGIAYDPDLTLDAYVDAARSAEPQEASSEKVIRIVSIADRRVFKRLTEADMDGLAEDLGIRVEFEHVCLPPTPVLLSEVVFFDYFLPRLEDQTPYSSALRQINLLRSASLILVDDAAELHFSLTQVYPVLSHRMERSPEADLLSFRWQSYTRGHDQLPITAVPGSLIDLADRDTTIKTLSKYLGVPIVRLATVESLREFTGDWEIQEIQSLSGGPGLRPLDGEKLVSHLAAIIRDDRFDIVPVESKSAETLKLNDLPHFCSHYIEQKPLDRVLESFDSFCIAGAASSVAYIPKRLRELGKEFHYVSSPSETALRSVPEFECLLVCGPTMEIEHQGPTACIMGGKHGARMLNVEGDPGLASLYFRKTDFTTDVDEWFHLSAPAGQTRDVSSIAAATRKAGAEREKFFEEREKRILSMGGIPDDSKPTSKGSVTMSDSKDSREKIVEARREQRRAERRAERQAERRAERQAERRAGRENEVTEKK